MPQVTDADHERPWLGLWRVPRPADDAPTEPCWAVVYHRHRAAQEWAVPEVVGLPTLLPLGRELANGGKVGVRVPG